MVKATRYAGLELGFEQRQVFCYLPEELNSLKGYAHAMTQMYSHSRSACTHSSVRSLIHQ